MSNICICIYIYICVFIIFAYFWLHIFGAPHQDDRREYKQREYFICRINIIEPFRSSAVREGDFRHNNLSHQGFCLTSRRQASLVSLRNTIVSRAFGRSLSPLESGKSRPAGWAGSAGSARYSNFNPKIRFDHLQEIAVSLILQDTHTCRRAGSGSASYLTLHLHVTAGFCHVSTKHWNSQSRSSATSVASGTTTFYRDVRRW